MTHAEKLARALAYLQERGIHVLAPSTKRRKPDGTKELNAAPVSWRAADVEQTIQREIARNNAGIVQIASRRTK